MVGSTPEAPPDSLCGTSAFHFQSVSMDLFHVAVYLADGLTFTKNGTSPVAPWTIMSVDQLKQFYRRRAENPRTIYHRLNSL